MSGLVFLFFVKYVEIKLLLVAGEKAIWQMCIESGSVFVDVFC